MMSDAEIKVRAFADRGLWRGLSSTADLFLAEYPDAADRLLYTDRATDADLALWGDFLEKQSQATPQEKIEWFDAMEWP